jgi:hypothetical protein
MTVFWFKSKPIIVDCFTDNSAAFDYGKVKLANKFTPDWWNNLPSLVDEGEIYPMPSMKTCIGFVELLKRGFMIPLWSDFALDIKENGNFSWQFSDGFSSCIPHYASQRGSWFPKENFVHLKLLSPWVLVEKTGVQWHAAHCSWNVNPFDGYFAPSALIEFYHQSNTHINLFFAYNGRDKKYLLNHGTPLTHYVPLSDKPIVLKHHLVTTSEVNRIANKQIPITFLNKYRYIKKLREKNT